jgi:hypothetical protein
MEAPHAPQSLRREFMKDRRRDIVLDRLRNPETKEQGLTAKELFNSICLNADESYDIGADGLDDGTVFLDRMVEDGELTKTDDKYRTK